MFNSFIPCFVLHILVGLQNVEIFSHLITFYINNLLVQFERPYPGSNFHCARLLLRLLMPLAHFLLFSYSLRSSMYSKWLSLSQLFNVYPMVAWLTMALRWPMATQKTRGIERFLEYSTLY